MEKFCVMKLIKQRETILMGCYIIERGGVSVITMDAIKTILTHYVVLSLLSFVLNWGEFGNYVSLPRHSKTTFL